MLPCLMLSSQSSRPLSSSPSFPSPCAPSVSAFSPLPSFRSAGIQTRIFLSSSALMTSLPTNSFTIRIYEKLASNPCRIRASKTQHLKSFRIRTYKKTGRGVSKNKTFHPVCQPSSLFRLTRTHGIPLAARLDYNARRMLMEEPCVWIKWKFPGTAKNPIG